MNGTRNALLGVISLLMTGAASAETIKVAADVGYAPHMIASADGYEGYSIDIMDEIAKRMGVEYEVIDQEWSGIFAGMAANRYVGIAAPVTVDEERAQKMLFGEPYMDKKYQFLVKKGGPKVESLDELAGMKIATNKGNTQDQWLSDPERLEKYKWEVIRFGKVSDAFQAVASGRADAAFDSEDVVGWAAMKNPLVTTSMIRIDSGIKGAFTFGLQNAEMRKRFEQALECMKTDGTLAAIHEKWVGQKPIDGSSSYTPYPGIGAPGFANYDESPSESGCS